ncbi:hypothetical protein ACFYVR_12690 [Rhodococcus sp. NPDC003318]|uniref:hypothetical protein n=1 Tax=Rhodococcus sp. NPDC003318 TaxID=3364503 RepID=UPI0036B3A06A
MSRVNVVATSVAPGSPTVAVPSSVAPFLKVTVPAPGYGEACASSTTSVATSAVAGIDRVVCMSVHVTVAGAAAASGAPVAAATPAVTARALAVAIRRLVDLTDSPDIPDMVVPSSPTAPTIGRRAHVTVVVATPVRPWASCCEKREQ